MFSMIFYNSAANSAANFAILSVPEFIFLTNYTFSNTLGRKLFNSAAL